MTKVSLHQHPSFLSYATTQQGHTGVAMVEKCLGSCFSKNEGVLESSRAIRYRAITGSINAKEVTRREVSRMSSSWQQSDY
jgi:hypothetical protein